MHPSCLCTQVPGAVAVESKLYASANMHPYVRYWQPLLSTFAAGMKLLALLSVQPLRTLMQPESTVAIESKLSISSAIVQP